MRTYNFEAPESLAALFELLKTAEGEVKLLAGGTDVVPKLNYETNNIPDGPKPPLTIVSLAKLGLEGVTETADEVIIGAMTTFSQLQKDEIINKNFPVLAEAIGQIAGLSVRNVATIGGNSMNASPAGDSIPVLKVLDAVYVLKSEAGERAVPADEFFAGPGKTVAEKGEVLTEIRIKKLSGKASFQKLGRRKAETLSVVSAAAYVEKEDGVCKVVRIAVGSAAPTAVRCKKTEEALAGKALTPEMVEELCKAVAEEIAPIDDIRSSAWYRTKVAPVVAGRAVKAALEI